MARAKPASACDAAPLALTPPPVSAEDRARWCRLALLMASVGWVDLDDRLRAIVLLAQRFVNGEAVTESMETLLPEAKKRWLELPSDQAQFAGLAVEYALKSTYHPDPKGFLLGAWGAAKNSIGYETDDGRFVMDAVRAILTTPAT